MTIYNDIEIHTAENLLGKGYKWIARDESGSLFAHTAKPRKRGNVWWSCGRPCYVCEEAFVPIFNNVKFEDSEPTSLEAIVHPQILDDAERRYLKAVIRPFRDKVTAICKVNDIESDYIIICLEFENLCLPDFPTGTMYKGMKKGHDYTIEELGL